MNKVNESGKVTFGQAWKDFWIGYVDFKGTSTRAGFWWGALNYFIIYFIWNIVNVIVDSYNQNILFSIGLDKTMTVITVAIHLIIIIPFLSVLSRRLRDIGLKEKVIVTLIVLYVALMITLLVSLLLSSVVIVRIVTFIEIILIIIFAILGCMPTGKFSNSSKEM